MDPVPPHPAFWVARLLIYLRDGTPDRPGQAPRLVDLAGAFSELLSPRQLMVVVWDLMHAGIVELNADGSAHANWDGPLSLVPDWMENLGHVGPVERPELERERDGDGGFRGRDDGEGGEGGGDDGGDGPGPGDDGDDGQGLREVLQHPRLFVLSDTDFDAALDRASGGEN